jgi:hypothetical protein
LIQEMAREKSHETRSHSPLSPCKPILRFGSNGVPQSPLFSTGSSAWSMLVRAGSFVWPKTGIMLSSMPVPAPWSPGGLPGTAVFWLSSPVSTMIFLRTGSSGAKIGVMLQSVPVVVGVQ